MPRRLALGKPGRKATTPAIVHSQARKAERKEANTRALQKEAARQGISVDELKARRFREGQFIKANPPSYQLPRHWRY